MLKVFIVPIAILLSGIVWALTGKRRNRSLIIAVSVLASAVVLACTLTFALDPNS
jgi:hypothetical protein